MAGDYTLLEPLGRGGAGIVFRAQQRSLNRTVAVKMLLAGQFANAEELRRFRAEAVAAARLDHPNIVPIHEIGEEEGRPFFSMKLVEGGTLAARLSTMPSGMPAREAARIIAKAARAVHYAHQRGFIHRDLKPANILLDAGDEPLVTDFGLAKQIENESAAIPTIAGTVLGTPGYMAPEQASGDAHGVTAAVDVFALGAVFYHLLTGHAPFKGTTIADTVRLSREQPPPRHAGPWPGAEPTAIWKRFACAALRKNLPAAMALRRRWRRMWNTGCAASRSAHGARALPSAP